MKLEKKSYYKDYPEDILHPDKLIKIIEGVNVTDIFTKHADEMFSTTQTYGITYSVYIDIRDGEIDFCQNIPGQSSADDCFFLDLGNFNHIYDFFTDDLLTDEECNMICSDKEKEAAIKHLNVQESDFDGSILNFPKIDCSLDEWIDFWTEIRDDFDNYLTRCENVVLYWIEEEVFETPGSEEVYEFCGIKKG